MRQFTSLMGVLLALMLCTAAQARPSALLRGYAKYQLQVDDFRWAEADLDGDGRAEQFLYAQGSQWCGSGGCTLFVLRRRGLDYEALGRITVVQLPIGVLPKAHRGCRDLAVGVGGGGAQAGLVTIRYDGRRYRGNPSMMRRMDAKPDGMVILMGRDARAKP